MPSNSGTVPQIIPSVNPVIPEPISSTNPVLQPIEATSGATLNMNPVPQLTEMTPGPIASESTNPVSQMPFGPIPTMNSEPVHILTNQPNPKHTSAVEQLIREVSEVGLPFDKENIEKFITKTSIHLQKVIPEGTTAPQVHNTTCSWDLNYTALSFIMNGHLYADFTRVAGMLGIPHCSSKQWLRIITKLEKHVEDLAEWSCERVRERVKQRGDDQEWVASYDGFYLTRGHHSNNSSATLHDYATGDIAWFKHRTKRGQGHNWQGTSTGAESSMFDEILKEVRLYALSKQIVIQ